MPLTQALTRIRMDVTLISTDSHFFEIIMTSVVSLSRPVNIRKLGDTPLDMTVEASEFERDAIARALDLRALTNLSADMRVSRRARSRGVDVTGILRADYEQDCVVTLEPIVQATLRDISLSFRPLKEMPEIKPDQHGDLVFASDQEDPPELLDGDHLDIGHIVLEEFSLSLDPFPRAPGAELPSELQKSGEQVQETGKENPFAVLASLRK